MKHFTPNPSRRNVRVFLATLLSYPMLVGQVAPLALASNNSAMRAAPVSTGGAGKAQGLAAAPVPAPLAPVAPAITAQKTDSFPDSDGDGKAVPGEEITYEVTVNNSGTDATNVQFTDTVDPNTTIVPGSVTMSPLARNDSYNADEDTQLVVPSGTGVLANDSAIPAPSATAIAAGATAQGGTVTLNADGSFTYDPPAGFNGSDSFTYTATNSNLPDDSATVTITVAAVDDAPTAVNDSATVNEDSAATTIDVIANDSDTDGGTNSVASVTPAAHGTAAVTNSGADVSYTPNANYCNSDTAVPDTFTYTLNGGSVGTVSVTVTCADDAPTAVNDSATVNEDSAATTINVLGNDDDPDAVDNKSVASVTPAAHGTAAVTNSGADVSYTPNANYCNSDTAVPDTFTYTLNGGSVGTVSVTVTCVDDAPTAVNDSATVPEDSGATPVAVLGNDDNADGGPISIASVTPGGSGTVLITGGGTGLTYQPNANYCNSDTAVPDTFTYTLNGGSSATVSVTVTCSDDAPVAVNDSATVVEDSGANAIDVLANENDIDGGPKSVVSVTPGANGTVLITGGGTGVSYQPNANYNGSDSFTYTLNGGSVGTVNVTVTEVNDAPATANDALTDVNEDSGTRVIAFSALLGNDSAGPSNENTQTLSVSNVSNFTGGTAVINGTNVEFTPTANFCGAAGFTYAATDNGTTNGASDPKSANGTVSFNLTCVNDAPSFTKGADQTVNEDAGAVTGTPNPWATAISAGPGEGSQTVSFNVSNDNNGLFAAGGQPAISPTGVLTFTTAPNAYGVATVTVSISDNGGTANGGVDTSATQTFTITINPVNDAPVAGADAWEFIGNTVLEVDAADDFTPEPTVYVNGNVLANDTDPVENDPRSVTTIVGSGDTTSPYVGASANGGSVSMQSDGTFIYTPKAGDTAATDSFQYTVTDAPVVGSPASANGTVTLTRKGRVWYVNNQAAAGGNGISVTPFDTLNEAETASLAGDTIYVFAGSGTTGQNGGIALKANQRLIGAGVALTVPVSVNGGANPHQLLPAGSQPQIGNSTAGGNGVTITNITGVEVRGLTISGNANAIDLSATGANNAGATIADNTISGAGAEGIDVNQGGSALVTADVQNNTIASTGNGFDARVTPTATGSMVIVLNNNTNITTSAAGIFIDGSGGGGGSTTTVTGFSGNKVSGNNAGAGVSVNTATFDATAGGGYQVVSGGDTDIGVSGNGVGAVGMSLTNVKGDLSFTDLDIYADGLQALSATSGAAFNAGTGAGFRLAANVGTGTFAATAGAAIVATTVQLNLQSIAVTSAGGVSGINLDDTDSSTVSVAAGSTISTSSDSATAFRVNNSTGTYAYAGTITTTDGKGVELTGNTGAAISFTGTLNLTTGEDPAFVATGGGTVSSTDTASVLTSTTGTPLNVTSTTIGAGGLKFRSISSNGAPNGIVLSATGATAGLTVSGNSSGQCGGAVTVNALGTPNTVTNPTVADCTGGNILNSTGNGISLFDTRDVSLTRVNIDNSDGSGIFGDDVTNFSLISSRVANNTDATGGAEAGLRFNELLGTCVITNSAVISNYYDNIRLTPSSGTLSSLAITGTTIGPNDPAVGNNGITILTSGTATATVTVDNSAFPTNRASAFLANSTATGTSKLTAGVTDTSFTDGNIAVDLGHSQDGELTFNISRNTFIGNDSNVINFSASSTSTNNGHVNGIIDNNRIGNGNPDSGSRDAFGIGIDAIGDVDMVLSITNNVVRHTDMDGIFAEAAFDQTSGGEKTLFDLTVRDNDVGTPDDNSAFPFGATYGTRVEARHDSDLCLDIAGNTSNDVGGVGDFRVRQRDTSGAAPVSTFRLERFSGNGASDTTVEAFIVAQNDPGSTADATHVSSFTGVPDGTCRNPSGVPALAPAFFSGSEAAAIRAKVTKDEKSGPAAYDEAKTSIQPNGSDLGRIPLVTGERTRPAVNRLNLPPSANPHPSNGVAPVAPQQPAQVTPAQTAPAVAAPAAPARVWSDMPVIINRTPRSDSAKDSDEAKGEEDAAKDDDAARDADAAPKKAKKPARTKKSGEPTEQQQPDAQPETRNISYLGPLGSAPARAAQFVRASYTAGDAVAPSARRVRPARASLKASPAPARAAAAVVGPDVNVPIGTMPTGKTVKIRFKVTVNSPFPDGVQQVSNQGTVTADGGVSVPTDDTSVGGASDPTVTPVNAISIRVNDATVAEAASGDSQMLFTVTLSNPAPAAGVSVSYATADGGATPATSAANCGGTTDYRTTNGTLNFASGEKVKTVSVTVCSDTAAPENSETLLLNISSPSTGTIADAQATGTITQGNTPGVVLISELRTSGPDPDAGGSKTSAGNDFVELYNNSDSAKDVSGYGLFKKGADCNAAPVLVAALPGAAGSNTTVIPARGHYLLVGSSYSLADYGGTGAAAGDQALTSDLENDVNVALFSTTDVTLISTANRADAVGFGANTGGTCDLLREGTNLPPVSGTTAEHAFFRKLCDFVGGACAAAGNPKETNDNLADFMFADTAASVISGVPQKLGAPGPENLASPTRRDDDGVGLVLLDTTKPSSAVPNRKRDLTGGDPNNSTFGALIIRRRVVNNTTNPISRLRFRIVEMTTAPNASGNADLRAVTGDDESGATVGQVNDPATCAAASLPTPCNVAVLHTTLETPPAQPGGGGINSTLAAGTIGLGSELPVNGSLNINFKLGIQKTGNFRFLIIIEALP